MSSLPDPEPTLRVRDFKGLECAEFEPRGVCVLAGPNGSGKSSLLTALEFMRRAATGRLDEAISWLGGGSHIRRAGAPPQATVDFSISHGDVLWTLGLAIEGAGLHIYHGELLKHDQLTIAGRLPREATWRRAEGVELDANESSSALRAVLDRGMFVEQLAGLRDFFEALTIYPPLCLVSLRATFTVAYPYFGAARAEGFSVDRSPLGVLRWDDGVGDYVGLRRPPAGSQRLLSSGENLIRVLKTWKSAPRCHQDRFEWVVTHLRHAFPDQVADIEFDVFRQSDEARIYLPNTDNASIPLHYAADGLLTGLLHLTAVAGAPKGGTIAIDEFEHHLHPHAIRSILASMRELADARDLTVILTTHSPVLMNEFRGHEDRFFVLEPGVSPTPKPIDQLKEPEWLAHYSLGDLYDDLDFGAPPLGRASTGERT